MSAFSMEKLFVYLITHDDREVKRIDKEERTKGSQKASELFPLWVHEMYIYIYRHTDTVRYHKAVW